MLILSRRLNQRIMIGDNIVVTVMDIDRGKIRLGVQAPKEILILRSELLPPTELDARGDYPAKGE